MSHSFGRIVDPPPELRAELDDYVNGVAVKLMCLCMLDPAEEFTIKLVKPWQRDEFEVLTEKEFALLLRYHDETCRLKIGTLI